MKTKTLVIFYPNCIEFEAILAAQVLHEERLTIDVATPDGTEYRQKIKYRILSGV